MIVSKGGTREGISMPKYLLLFKYSSDGAKGFLKEKAAPREAEIRKTFARIRGKVEAFYWGSGGEHTGAIIVELPDAAAQAGFTMVAEATGAFDAVTWTELLTSNELDRAFAKTISYRPPGG
jgi:uncharacterized protein with GYD domain